MPPPAPRQPTMPPPAAPTDVEVTVSMEADGENASASRGDEDVIIDDAEIGAGAGAASDQADASGFFQISETDGYFLVSYPPVTPSDERLSFSEGVLLREFNQLVMGMPAGKDYPLLEGKLCKFKPGNYPPVTIHGYDYQLATAICSHYEFVTLQLGDKQATLQIQAKRTMFDKLFAASGPRGPTFHPTMKSHLATAGGWIEIQLTDQQIDMGTSIHDVVTATEAIGLGVCMCRGKIG